MNKIVIEHELCKGCGLCVRVCPKQIFGFSSEINTKGYVPIQCNDETKCIGCTMCTQICPDMVIEIFSDKEDK
jgi:2-oxoglutarate ferredoxin oxidoreductase subunit delta